MCQFDDIAFCEGIGVRYGISLRYGGRNFSLSTIQDRSGSVGRGTPSLLCRHYPRSREVVHDLCGYTYGLWSIFQSASFQIFEEMGDTITMPGKSNAAENLNRRGIASSPRMESHVPPVKVEGTKPVAMKPKAAAKDMVWNDGDRVKHTILEKVSLPE